MAKGKKTGGRKRGVLNKVTAEVKSLAQAHGPEAIAELARIMRRAKNEQARIAAARELLDRGYGRPAQAVMVWGEDGAQLGNGTAALSALEARLARLVAPGERVLAPLIEHDGGNGAE